MEEHSCITNDEIIQNPVPAYDFERVGIGIEAIHDEVDHLISQIEEFNQPEKNLFPLKAFPERIRSIINSLNESLNFPIDFSAVSILFVISVAIGNMFKVKIFNGYIQSCILFIALVGRPGTMKTHPIAWAINPLQKVDQLRYQQYILEKKIYDDEVRVVKGKKKPEIVDKPFWRQLLVSDFTPEVLAEILKYNTRGVGVYSDEINTWISNFDRYSGSNDESRWLSIYSGTSITVNRKSSEPTRIKNPFASVIGSIQPGVLVKILEKRIENGFAHRLLFAYPDDLKVEYWTQNQLNPKIPEDWQTIVNSILDMEFGSEEGKILEFSRDAEQKMILWQRDLADMANRCSNEQICGLFPKIEQYSIRLALILQVLYYVCQEGSIRCIGIEATEGAIELAKYFINTATKVHNQCSLNNPLKKLPLDKQNVYNALPYKFSTGEALKIALSLGMSNRNLFRFIKDIKFFRLLKKGQYEKIL